MKKIFLLALVFALLTGGLFFTYLRALDREAAVEYDEVVVAAADIPAVTTLTADMLALERLPKGAGHPAAARDVASVVGLVTDSALLPGEQLLPSKLKTLGSSADGLAYAIEPGKRAITIMAAEDTLVGYYPKEGDYVDVLSLVSDPLPPEGSRDQNAAYLVAENLRILAVGSPLDVEGAAPQSVTLMVTPEQAMRFVLTTDRFRLVLRGVGDHVSSGLTYQWNTGLLPDDAWRSVIANERQP